VAARLLGEVDVPAPPIRYERVPPSWSFIILLPLLQRYTGSSQELIEQFTSPIAYVGPNTFAFGVGEHPHALAHEADHEIERAPLAMGANAVMRAPAPRSNRTSVSGGAHRKIDFAHSLTGQFDRAKDRIFMKTFQSRPVVWERHQRVEHDPIGMRKHAPLLLGQRIAKTRAEMLEISLGHGYPPNNSATLHRNPGKCGSAVNS
jgi:hypothetical protein